MTINAEEKGQYVYFSSLERTIKIALAVYIVLLSGGVFLLATGLNETGPLLQKIPYPGILLTLALFVLFGTTYLIVSRVHQLGELHIWLDQRFFGFLEKSNEIIFQAVVRVLESGEQSFPSGLGVEERDSVIKSIFTRLADNFRLFDSLMESGIFRYWIWYWVMNYGTFTFTILTILSSIAMFAGAGAGVRTFFTICWISSLAHLAVNLTLGNLLTRLTRSVSESIILTYKPQITMMLRESIQGK